MIRVIFLKKEISKNFKSGPYSDYHGQQVANGNCEIQIISVEIWSKQKQTKFEKWTSSTFLKMKEIINISMPKEAPAFLKATDPVCGLVKGEGVKETWMCKETRYWHFKWRLLEQGRKVPWRITRKDHRLSS